MCPYMVVTSRFAISPTRVDGPVRLQMRLELSLPPATCLFDSASMFEAMAAPLGTSSTMPMSYQTASPEWDFPRLARPDVAGGPPSMFEGSRYR